MSKEDIPHTQTHPKPVILKNLECLQLWVCY